MAEVKMTPEEFEEMLDRVAKKGARAALEEIGLHETGAAKDIEDLRSLLASWRQTRKTVWVTAVKWITIAILGFISVAVWTHLKGGMDK